VLDPPCHIVSDLHLGAAHPDVERRFLSYLRAVPGTARSLLINGDLFDFWFEWRSVIPRHTFRVLAAVAGIVEAGIPVLWIAGNHDCWGGDFLRREVGVTYHVGPWEGVIAGWRAMIEHGDGLRPKEDRGYRALRAVLRSRPAVAAMRVLHPDIGSWLASGSSEASRTHRARDGGAGLRAVARERLARSGGPGGPELLVFGHSHVATLERAGGGIYANAGSWLDDATYLQVHADRIELHRWRDSAESERLHALDRRPEKALP
jgi:UDP-2,3-diacylglucosamine hydrolase